MSNEDVNTQTDQLLFNLLKECKTLPIFLDKVFGFLSRRTDFYYVAKDSNSPVGLPEGLAESLVRHTYLKWRNKDDVVLQEEDIPPVVLEEEVVANEELIDNMEALHIEEIHDPHTQSLEEDSEVVTSPIFSNSDSFNGSSFDNYSWSQSISDVDITIKLPPDCISKNLVIQILTNKISVKLKDQVILNGYLCQKCKNTEAIWSMVNQRLCIHLDKCREMWWDCLITTENRLDLSTLDCSRPFEDLPQDAQAKIEELGWNQERKRLGLPTSDELAKQELLKRAWNAEGSPFSGPFDPSQVVFN